MDDEIGKGRNFSSRTLNKAIKYHEKDLKIAKEIGDRAGEGGAYGNIGNAYQSLGDHEKAIESHKKHLKIAIEVGNRAGDGIAYQTVLPINSGS